MAIRRISLRERLEEAGRAIRLIVKGRTAGDWQGTIADGQPVRAAPDTFWVFVDLAVTPAEFYLVPDAWMRWDISMLILVGTRRSGTTAGVTRMMALAT